MIDCIFVFLQCLWCDDCGIFVVEFVIIVLLMLIIYLGFVEVFLVLLIDCKIISIVSVIVDFVVQDDVIIDDEIVDIFNVGNVIIVFFDFGLL